MNKRDDEYTTVVPLAILCLVLFAIIRWVLWPWLLTPTIAQRELTAKIAIFGICALPLALILGIKIGQQRGKERHQQAGRSEAWGQASRQIAAALERVPERANDYLAGAKRGLEIVDNMTRARAAARIQQIQAPAAPMIYTPLEYIEAETGAVTDV